MLTIFGILLDTNHHIKIVIDEEILKNEYYGCSDGVTTSYMKIKTDDIVSTFLNYTNHRPIIIQM